MWRRTNQQNLSKVVYKKEKFEIIIVPRPEVKCPISVHMSHREARQQPKGNPTKTYTTFIFTFLKKKQKQK